MVIEFANRLNGTKRIKLNESEINKTALLDLLNKTARFRPADSGVTADSNIYIEGPLLRMETPQGFKSYDILPVATDFDYEV